MNANRNVRLLTNAPLAARLAPIAAALALSSCASPEPGIIPAPLFAQPELQGEAGTAQQAAGRRADANTKVSEAPAIPARTRSSSVKAGAADADPNAPADTTLMFDQLPLPNFIQIVFGSILKKNFSLDPALMGRTDLVTLRTSKPQTHAQVLETTRMLLKTYGIAVTELGGFYRIAPDSNQSAYAPEIRRGRAEPEVPLPLRPVFNLVEMTSVRNSEVSQWLKAMFGTRVTIQDDSTRNALLLSGQSADVTAALEAIQILDQPLMRGRSSKLVTPGSLGSEDLSRKLVEILSAEGYAVATGAAPGVAISLISIPASNSLLVFTLDDKVLAHVVAWAQKLDTLDTNNRRNGSYFTYRVKYADAQSLAKTLQELMSADAATAAATAVANAPAAGTRVIGAAPKQTTGRIVVNSATNTLIFSCSEDEYSQLQGIMRELDQPAKSALIQVTVAEVQLGDSNNLGIEWSLPGTTINGRSVIGGTLGGLGLGTDGLRLSFLNSAGAVRANLNALASKNRASILSTPSIMARNGETATIQVGSEVPTVTSQASSTAGGIIGGGAGIGVLQTIQYRSVGVILKVKPVIFAGGRIELDVSQEVSSAAQTQTGVSSSPTISTRKIDTKLSIRDGATVLLGGLMSSNDTTTDTGVPFLKDIPIAGQLFRSNTVKKDKTELLVLITPYVIDNDMVAEEVTNAFRGQMGSWAGTVPGSATPLPKPVAPTTAIATPGSATQPATGSVVQEVKPSETVDLPLPEAIEKKDAAMVPDVSAPVAATAATGPVPAASAPMDFSRMGKPVTDPALLEEIRRARATPNSTAQVANNKGKPASPSASSPKKGEKSHTQAVKKDPKTNTD